MEIFPTRKLVENVPKRIIFDRNSLMKFLQGSKIAKKINSNLICSIFPEDTLILFWDGCLADFLLKLNFLWYGSNKTTRRRLTPILFERFFIAHIKKCIFLLT